jgi:hypothetical protein
MSLTSLLRKFYLLYSTVTSVTVILVTEDNDLYYTVQSPPTLVNQQFPSQKFTQIDDLLVT